MTADRRAHWRRLEGDVVRVVDAAAGKLLIEDVTDPTKRRWVTAESSNHWSMA